MHRLVAGNKEVFSAITIILNRKAGQVSAKDALNNFEQIVEAISPDLILSYKNSGWADACDLREIIKSEKIDVPVIVFSARYKKRAEYIDAGAGEFMDEMFELDAFPDTI